MGTRKTRLFEIETFSNFNFALLYDYNGRLWKLKPRITGNFLEWERIM